MHQTLLKTPDLLTCRLIERINRFVILIDYHGHTKYAHISNTGRLLDYLTSRRVVYCLRQPAQLKTDFRLVGVEDGADAAALIDTRLQMQAFEQGLQREIFPWIKGVKRYDRDFPIGASRIDYGVHLQNGTTALIKVKSAVLRQGNSAMYPDCPSTRGQKHIRELIRYRSSGGEAHILFIAALPAIQCFRSNQQGDPEIFELLQQARLAGVDIHAIGMFLQPSSGQIVLYEPDLPVQLEVQNDGCQ